MRRGLCLAALAAVAFGVGCTDPSCTEKLETYTASADAAPPAGGSMVAHLDLAQTFKTYGPAGCSGEPLQSVGVVTATVTNVTSAPIALSFTLEGLNTAGIPAWHYPDTAWVVVPRMEPSQSIDLGEVATTTTKLTGGARLILTSYEQLP
jgi:hypothetical protein